jgi:hypothetical protein
MNTHIPIYILSKKDRLASVILGHLIDDREAKKANHRPCNKKYIDWNTNWHDLLQTTSTRRKQMQRSPNFQQQNDPQQPMEARHTQHLLGQY